MFTVKGTTPYTYARAMSSQKQSSSTQPAKGKKIECLRQTERLTDRRSRIH